MRKQGCIALYDLLLCFGSLTLLTISLLETGWVNVTMTHIDDALKRKKMRLDRILVERGVFGDGDGACRASGDETEEEEPLLLTYGAGENVENDESGRAALRNASLLLDGIIVMRKIPARMFGVRVTTSLILSILGKMFLGIFLLAQFLITVSEDIDMSLAC